jgi:hypothetical protein
LQISVGFAAPSSSEHILGKLERSEQDIFWAIAIY